MRVYNLRFTAEAQSSAYRRASRGFECDLRDVGRVTLSEFGIWREFACVRGENSPFVRFGHSPRQHFIGHWRVKGRKDRGGEQATLSLLPRES